MGEGPKRPATYEDLVALPEHLVGQIVDGELIVMSRPASAHGRASSRLYGELYGVFERGRGGPGGWLFIVEPELHFGQDVLVPDLAGWRRERMPEMPDVPFFTQAPDWVCEVLSPSTATLDRVRKKRIYAREGVKYVWLVDPKARTLEAYRGEGHQWVALGTHPGDQRARVEPFEELELELGRLWLSERKEP
ncbi:Uma2 family endonuclease [Myxococcus stipitatus]|uniref:Uma2 family endonuclease n=1 Tax=Myxococcus stipitatus TaxID=83455 RepID=UPI001F387810|nr:Uma2 family endonuclease [Myxococcus stipitatus]MCE9669010.1 Uma2 family endonuclease [Myxococcus stipitatus]